MGDPGRLSENRAPDDGRLGITLDGDLAALISLANDHPRPNEDAQALGV
jgi:hypothetical protein